MPAWAAVNVMASAAILREVAGLATHIKGEVVPADRPGESGSKTTADSRSPGRKETMLTSLGCMWCVFRHHDHGHTRTGWSCLLHRPLERESCSVRASLIYVLLAYNIVRPLRIF